MTTRKIWCDVIFRTLHGYETVKQRDKPLKTKKTKGSKGWKILSFFFHVVSNHLPVPTVHDPVNWFNNFLIDKGLVSLSEEEHKPPVQHCQKPLGQQHRGFKVWKKVWVWGLWEWTGGVIVSQFDPSGWVVLLLPIIIKPTTHTCRDRIQTRQNSARQ